MNIKCAASESVISAFASFGSVNSLFSSTNNPNLAFKSLWYRHTEGSFFPTLASLSQRTAGKQIHTIRCYCATRSRCNKLKHELRSPCSFSFAAKVGRFYMFICQQRYALRRHRLQKETVKIIILKKIPVSQRRMVRGEPSDHCQPWDVSNWCRPIHILSGMVSRPSRTKQGNIAANDMSNNAWNKKQCEGKNTQRTNQLKNNKKHFS